MELDSRQRQYLKGLAHHLKPIVHVGKDGITPSLLRQIDEALLQHELIKIKLTEGSPLDRKAASVELPAKTGAAFVQNIGRVFVLYREHPEEPTIDLPVRRPAQIQELDEDEEPDTEAVTAEEAAPPTITFGPSVRVRGAVPKPVAPAIRERPELDGEDEPATPAKPKSGGGRAKAKPRSKQNKPPRSMQQRRGSGKKKKR
jgi:RNA-binding protein